VRPHAGKTWQHVLQLRQFNLRFGMKGSGSACKDVKNQNGSVQDLTFKFSLNISELRWAQFVVKNDEFDVERLHVLLDFFKLTGAYISAGIWVR
jgi:hypothetical protein